MRKFLAGVVLVCGMSLTAQSQAWQLFPNSQAADWAQMHPSVPISLVSTLQDCDAVLPFNPKKGPRRISEASGELHTYALTNVRINQGGTFGNCGRADSLYVQGTSVYVRNIIDDGRDGSFIEGQLTDGDLENGTITFPNGVEYADGHYAYIGTVDEAGHLVPNREAESFTFTVKNGTIRSVAPEETKGHFYLMGYSKAGGLLGYNIDYVFEPVPIDVANVVIPSNVEMKSYVAECQPVGSQPASHLIAQIGFDNDDVYIKNIIPALGEAAIMGKVEGDKIVFDVKKYIGKYQDIYISFFAGVVETTSDGKVVLSPVNTDKLYMDYDAVGGTIKCNDVLVFLAGMQAIGGYWNQPVFKPFNQTPVTIPGSAEATRYNMSTRALPDQEDGRISTEVMVYRDSDDFYFCNFYPLIPGLAFKGTLEDDGQTIAVEVPQYMGHGSQEEAIMLASANHVEQVTIPPSAIYTYDDFAGKMFFNFDPDDKSISYEGSFCTVIYGTTAPISGCDNPVWTVQTDTLAVIPASATTQHYMLKTDHLRDYSRMAEMNIPTYVTSVAQDGDNYYFHGLNEDYTKINNNAVLVGHRHGDKVICSMPQLISLEGNDMVYAYVVNYDVANDQVELAPENQFVFDLDPETNILTSHQTLLVATASGVCHFCYVNPSYQVYAPQPAKPKYGLPSDHSEETSGSRGPIYAHFAEFFYEDVDGNYLSPDSLTYSLFFDDELYTFENYFYFEEFTEDVTEVPMNTVSGHFNMYLMERRIWTPDKPKKNFGLQVHYYCNGVKTSSDIATMNMRTGELTVTEVNPTVATPANPIPERWRDRGQRMYNFMFTLPNEDTEGNPLNEDNLYYVIYMDGSPYTFRGDDYWDIEEDMTEIPATLNTSSFNKSDNDYMLLLREEPEAKIGVQAVYKVGDSVTSSQIGYYDIFTDEVTYEDGPTSGVASIGGSSANVVREEYFLLSGVRVENPAKGLFILRQTFTDGSVKNTKVALR